ncbi:MAG: hypothetical protein OD811_05130 [Alphaproteobacteria bacterium]
MAEPEVRLHEPRAALDGGADGLEAYRSLGVAMSSGALEVGMFALVELAPEREAEILLVLGSAGFGVGAIFRDLAGLSRMAWLIRV